MLANVLSRSWWMLLLRGVLWILFGLLVATRPAISFFSLTLLLAVLLVADGVLNTVNALRGRKEEENWWVMLLAGVAGIWVGVLMFWNIGLSELALLFYIAIWSIATGLLEIVAAVRLRKEIRGELWLILAGIVSVAFGVLVMVQPGAGALALLWLIAVYAIAFGVILIVLAFEARGFVKRLAAA